MISVRSADLISTAAPENTNCKTLILIECISISIGKLNKQESGCLIQAIQYDVG